MAPNHGEADLLAIAAAFEAATGFDRDLPPLITQA
jgi:amidase